MWDPDNEDHPRNAAAIRTALMLGAEFNQDITGRWWIEGIHAESSKSMCAWLFIGTHGICIDKDARAVLCKDMHHEDIK